METVIKLFDFLKKKCKTTLCEQTDRLSVNGYCPDCQYECDNGICPNSNKVFKECGCTNHFDLK